MKKIICAFSLAIILVSFLAVPATALAQSATATPAMASNHLLDMLSAVGTAGGYQTDPAKASTPMIVGLIIRAFLNFLGITFIILMIIAGYGWMTANGNEEQVKKSIATIKQSLIGLIVAISAWTIWNFVLEKLILMK